MPDLDIIIVSHGDRDWLHACLASIEARRGDCEVQVIVVENGPGPDFDPAGQTGPVRVERVPNRGFAAGNNDGLQYSTARHVLFLNPDTEILAGALASIVRYLDGHTEVAMVAVRQVDANGETWPSIRRFPTVMRTFGAAIGTERWPRLNRLFGERVLIGGDYDRPGSCDWTTGAVMFVRAEALRQVGPFDERFFLYSEETDLAYRLRRAGWSNVYLPSLVVLHHAGKAGVVPRLEAQMAYARWQYARKHAGRLAQAGFMLALVAHHGLRALLLRRRPTSSSSATASVYSLRVLAGLAPPPFKDVP